ncbi:MAG: glycine cleavage system protein GcvH [Acidobacteria bacterium]|nr:glycine cleavage system protein GcvH [Acidobacteriota bacterium]NIM60537.1 glycine cleavage system protein GcvH [Acidobacteriota bacterium]NIO59508.1 glycine cleavage system protein GcvH [Acidobacteriota bacterium]NIQ30537.1 glycine cleavage system protein GcvH [Acidobacteriota bacterium]NIQ85485.1 glycine cleavage system protein GcvH [Acidobacteriota bacterium]
MVPTDRRYSKQHEWVLVSDDVATIGITHFAQDQLGDIVFVELPEVHAELSRDEVMGTIESVKAVSEIFAPISGTVLEVNTELEATPETVNSDPNGAGWYCKMSIADPEDIERLMDAAAYEQLTKEG